MSELTVKAKKLTLKQELFCRAFIRFKGNATRAYKEIFITDNMQEVTVNREAHRMKELPNVATRITLLEEDLYTALGITEEWRLNSLKKIIEDAHEEKKYDASVRGMAEINKMVGGYKPQQIDQTNIQRVIVTEIKVPSNGRENE